MVSKDDVGVDPMDPVVEEIDCLARKRRSQARSGTVVAAEEAAAVDEEGLSVVVDVVVATDVVELVNAAVVSAEVMDGENKNSSIVTVVSDSV